jgi:hypothetical protein
MTGSGLNQLDTRPPSAPREAPTPSGELVASFARPGYGGKPAGEVRVTLDEYQGHRYLGLRLWEAGQGGAWFPTRKGLSVRLSEAEDMAGALLRGLEMAGGPGSPRGGRQLREERFSLRAPAGPRRSVTPAMAAPPPSPDFDEFAGGMGA